MLSTKTWRRNRKSETARKVELYSSAYKLARIQIPPTLSRELPDLSLRIHASIRRQLKAGETDARRIAFEAVQEAVISN
jgi:hypothetical protein